MLIHSSIYRKIKKLTQNRDDYPKNKDKRRVFHHVDANHVYKLDSVLLGRLTSIQTIIKIIDLFIIL